MPPTDAHLLAAPRHEVIDPAILYFGTPVVLLSTTDGEGAVDLAPISSAFWLGHTAVLGIGTRSQTARNLLATEEIVLNLPAADLVSAVDRLALTTGRDPVPTAKHDVGYRYEPDKFAAAGLHEVPSDLIRPPRVAECSIAMEGRLVSARALEGEDIATDGVSGVFEVEVLRTHIDPGLRMDGHQDRIDPTRWRPLIMSFQRFFGLGDEVHPSRLATIDEDWYR
jgi:flavin reductase (DIM6/NTAB) family NADH-FMN oxidoreductase RutF